MGKIKAEYDKDMQQGLQKPSWDMWRAIRQFDHITGKHGYMFLFLGNSFYFILALCGDYEVPIYLANLSVAFAMVLLFQALVRLIRWEGEDWHTLYEKICYFPVDRKKYLLAKALPAGKTLALLVVIQGIVFLCRTLMQQPIALATMVLISTCTVVSGICFFLGFLALLVAGNRALNLIPLLFGIGIMINYVLVNIITG